MLLENNHECFFKDTVKLKGTIGFEDFAAAYNAHVTFMGVGIDASVAAAIASVEIRLAVSKDNWWN
jgi:hypothetical protein